MVMKMRLGLLFAILLLFAINFELNDSKQVWNLLCTACFQCQNTGDFGDSS